MLAEKFSQDSLETFFCKHCPPGAWKDNLVLYDFGYFNTFWNQKVLKPIAIFSIRDENINFAYDRSSSIT